MSPGPGTRAWFEGYLAAFNTADFEGFGAFYHPRLEFHGQAAQFVGREAVLAFYRGVRDRLAEHIELVSFVGSSAMCAAEIATTLHAHEDWLDFPTGPLRAGETRTSINFAFYDIAEARFIRIRSARFRSLP